MMEVVIRAPHPSTTGAVPRPTGWASRSGKGPVADKSGVADRDFCAAGRRESRLRCCGHTTSMVYVAHTLSAASRKHASAFVTFIADSTLTARCAETREETGTVPARLCATNF
jgi:hypothetical protein